VKLDPWKTWHEAEDQPAEYQQDRVGDLDPVGEGRERGHRDEQDEDRLYLRQSLRLLLSPALRTTRPASLDLRLANSRLRYWLPTPL
jgi:hypothetical protein